MTKVTKVAVYFDGFWPSIDEAVADLHETGALMVRDRRGSVVRPISSDDLADRYVCIYDVEEF